jgi:hypothetical protein
VPPQCHVCQQGAEDIRHLLFTFVTTIKVWKELALTEVTEDALLADKSGSVVLEVILCSKKKPSPLLAQLKIHEMITIVCWYIWWQRREFVKGESVARPSNTVFAIML